MVRYIFSDADSYARAMSTINDSLREGYRFFEEGWVDSLLRDKYGAEKWKFNEDIIGWGREEMTDVSGYPREDGTYVMNFPDPEPYNLAIKKE